MRFVSHTCVLNILLAAFVLPSYAQSIMSPPKASALPDSVKRCLEFSFRRHQKQAATNDADLVSSSFLPTISSPSKDVAVSSMTETYCEDILDEFLSLVRVQLEYPSSLASLNQAKAMRDFAGERYEEKDSGIIGDVGDGDENEDHDDDDRYVNGLPSKRGQLLKNSEFMSKIRNTVSEKNMQDHDRSPRAENNEDAGSKLKSLLPPIPVDAPQYIQKIWLKKLIDINNVLKSKQAHSSQNANRDFTQSGNNAETIAASEHSSSENMKMAPSKRGVEDPWINVIRTVVAKRRRQTLSINNALMALTDMLLAHGKEQLQRNRDNLRYHMYVQG